ncbi:hypothetical protein [Liberiplasma polymorphum]|uniref:hypothetical protein n=1 Tax=Liberiplasma polymorphum TaxID=3374570 RepID=UPI003775612E
MKESDLITGTCEMLEKGVIYDASKIYHDHFHPLFNEVNYYQVLSRMVKNNRLIKVAKGLYYSPEYKDGNQVPLTHKHIKKFMLPYHGLGFAVGESLYYRLKLTSTKPSNYTYYVNHIEEKTRTIQNTKFIRIYSEINADIIKHIEFIDILEHFDSIHNINLEGFNHYISSFITTYDENIMKHTIKVIKPKKRTIAFLKEILDGNSIDNSSGLYLSTTSKYHIPKWITGS